MSNFWYLEAILAVTKKEIDLTPSTGDSIRALLVMDNSTADTDVSAKFIDDFTVFDEMNGSGYVRKVITTTSIGIDAPNSRVELIANNSVWSALGAGSRDVKASVIFKFVTDDSDSPVLAYVDTGGFPFTATGADFTINWNAEGIFQWRSAA